MNSRMVIKATTSASNKNFMNKHRKIMDEKNSFVTKALENKRSNSRPGRLLTDNKRVTTPTQPRTVNVTKEELNDLTNLTIHILLLGPLSSKHLKNQILIESKRLK